MINHKEDCLSINGKQSVDVEEGIIEFKNYSRKLLVLFKIYECNLQNFECNLQNAEIYEGSYTKKYHDHVPCSFAYKGFVLRINLVSRLLFIEEKMLLMNLLKQFLKNISIVKK